MSSIFRRPLTGVTLEYCPMLTSVGAPGRPRVQGGEGERRAQEVLPAAQHHLEFGSIVASEKEAPNILSESGAK
jgi:hypothetical protein